MSYDIKSAIPHREPFLLLDEILEIAGEKVRAAATLRPDGELWSRVYAGHYPGTPVTPGVLLCEMIFQASAVLAHELIRNKDASGIPMVTRIREVKFRRPILPGDRVEVQAELVEKMSNALFMKGGISKDGKIAVEAQFAVAMVQQGE
ncbi:MAG: beta-hydroxyacyl-ACP dehydratase [Planctomycetes bacterium]|nr:beta-hydroxyacyl-ACP dehydratase [Planctomycetota bacterium]